MRQRSSAHALREQSFHRCSFQSLCFILDLTTRWNALDGVRNLKEFQDNALYLFPLIRLCLRSAQCSQFLLALEAGEVAQDQIFIRTTNRGHAKGLCHYLFITRNLSDLKNQDFKNKTNDDEELSSNGNTHRLISQFKCQLSIGKRELFRRSQTRHKQVLYVKSLRVQLSVLNQFLLAYIFNFSDLLKQWICDCIEI